ncbi:MAG: GNAT family protein [Rhodobacteraceae bacterium]|nr:GNAT family protein [Paracoccaceae bacterium]
MIFDRSEAIKLYTERLYLRLPLPKDYEAWYHLKSLSQNFLKPWEPIWESDHLTRTIFIKRIKWAKNSVANNYAFPFFIFSKTDQILLGGINLDYIRERPSKSAIVGFWIGEPFARKGYMQEALQALVHFAFYELDLSRIEASCLPTNIASRGLLEKSGFKYEGVAQSYLEIAGKWQNHVIYANLRSDRRGNVS